MDYNTTQEMLPDYIRGFLNEEESRLVQSTLAGSESLRREYDQLRSYYSALDTLEPVKASDTFINGIQTRIAAPLLFSQLIKKIFMPLQVKLPLELAGLAFTAGLVIVIFNPFDSKNIPPVAFDESSMQARKAPVDIKTIEEPEAEQVEEIPVQRSVDQATPKPSEGKTVSRLLAAKPAVKSKRSATAPRKKNDFGAGGIGRLDDRPKGSHSYTGKKDAEQPQTVDKLALLEKAPSSPAAGGYTDAEQYVAKVMKESDDIVYQVQKKAPAIDDVGLLALTVTLQKSDKLRQSMVLSDIQAEVTHSRMSRREKRVLKKKEAKKLAYDADISAAITQPPASEVTFAALENTITAHNGIVKLMEDKPQTPKKKHYLIEISRDHFPALKKELESEGTLSDEEFSIETSETDLIRFNLIISID